MSPASSGTLEVERYIGACLISQTRSAKSNCVPIVNKPRNEHHVFGRQGARDHFLSDVYHHQHHHFRLQRCQSADGWAGGLPLVSFANSQRRGRRHDADGRVLDVDPHQASPLARLAVHTQGAPLILAKSYNHRKNKVHRNAPPSAVSPTVKIFDGSNVAKKPQQQQTKCQEQQNSANGVDAVSVTSDESSGSANSETCLPRIIKPRKRRKKDRKPPLLGRPLSQDGFSTDSASPDIVDNSQAGVIALGSFLPFAFDPYATYRVSESPRLIDRCHILGDISETPKLHHSFDDVEEPEDGKDINGNQPASTCQCRYCDPSGQIWDVDRSCYSPFLTPPKAFQFPAFGGLEAATYTTPMSSSETRCLERGMSTVSLEEEEGSKSGDKPSPSPPSRSSSSSSCRDLEVSTEIVTSLNGHRDLEIKFFSAPIGQNGPRGKETAPQPRHHPEVSRSDKCSVVNNECSFVSEE